MAPKATVCNDCHEPFTDADPRSPKRGTHRRCHNRITRAQYHAHKGLPRVETMAVSPAVQAAKDARVARYAAAVAAGIPLDDVRKDVM